MHHALKTHGGWGSSTNGGGVTTRTLRDADNPLFLFLICVCEEVVKCSDSWVMLTTSTTNEGAGGSVFAGFSGSVGGGVGGCKGEQRAGG